jgi:hypothetical protein
MFVNRSIYSNLIVFFSIVKPAAPMGGMAAAVVGEGWNLNVRGFNGKS